MYHQKQVPDEPDILRARFTVWIKKLIINAKIDFLRQKENDPVFISIEDLSEVEQLIGVRGVVVTDTKDAFDFEEEKLAEAFYKLPLMKRKILELLFVDCMKPEDIARHLNCSSQYVYNQRYLALKRLRQQLDKDGEIK